MADPSSTSSTGQSQPTRRPTALLRAVSSSFTGPLPPPDLLEGYEKVCPGAAAKILEAMQIEGEHRRNLEKKSLDANIEGMRRQFSESRLGQIFAFSITVLFVFVGAYVVLHGQPWSGTILGSVGLGGIVTAFLARRREHGEETEPTTASGEANPEPRP